MRNRGENKEEEGEGEKRDGERSSAKQRYAVDFAVTCICHHNKKKQLQRMVDKKRWV